MVTVDKLHSEVVVGDAARSRDDADKPFEVRIEELREIVRDLIREEFERVMRIEVVD